ncbi:MAG: hypothetical protein ACE5JO_07705, partial [Candidatus Binatia bacterium]
ALSFIPLATCLDYAADPAGYDPERSWAHAIRERFGDGTLDYWRAIREFCDRINKLKDKNRPLPLSAKKRSALDAAYRYILENQDKRWLEEFRPWLDLLEKNLSTGRNTLEKRSPSTQGG